ncbi:hypothetical protein DENSPDRAFT_881901 [Dentipellis sp. KUC8613]|nr:hypothetical protein DENSPDRAFT_881901 [Dentipellis sp. KUC8613]
MVVPYPGLTQYLSVPSSSRVLIKDRLSFTPESPLYSLPTLEPTPDTQENPLTVLCVTDVTFRSLTAFAWRVPISDLLEVVGEPNCMDDIDCGMLGRNLNSPDPDIDLRTELPHTDHLCPSEQYIENLLKGLPLDDLRYLALDGGSISWSPEEWIQVLRRCEKVEHMIITGTAAHHVGIALGVLSDGNDSAERPPQEADATRIFSFLPRLRTLVFEDVDFLLPPAVDLHKQIRDALALRAGVGRPVKLWFTECTLNAAVVESFRGVSEVEKGWNDYREGSEDSGERDSERSEDGGNEGEDATIIELSAAPDLSA